MTIALINNNEDSAGLIKLAKVTLWTILIVGSVLILKFFGNLIKPLVVLITLAIWGTIWGVLGMIISVPVTSILVIVLAQFKETRNIAILLSEAGNIENMVVPEREPNMTTPAHLQFWKYWKSK